MGRRSLWWIHSARPALRSRVIQHPVSTQRAKRSTRACTHNTHAHVSDRVALVKPADPIEDACKESTPNYNADYRYTNQTSCPWIQIQPCSHCNISYSYPSLRPPQSLNKICINTRSVSELSEALADSNLACKKAQRMLEEKQKKLDKMGKQLCEQVWYTHPTQHIHIHTYTHMHPRTYLVQRYEKVSGPAGAAF